MTEQHEQVRAILRDLGLGDIGERVQKLELMLADLRKASLPFASVPVVDIHERTTETVIEPFEYRG